MDHGYFGNDSQERERIAYLEALCHSLEAQLQDYAVRANEMNERLVAFVRFVSGQGWSSAYTLRQQARTLLQSLQANKGDGSNG